MFDTTQLIHITGKNSFVDFTAAAAVRETRGGQVEKLALSFGPWQQGAALMREARVGELVFTHCLAQKGKSLRIGLSVRNEGAKPVYIESLTPFLVGPGALKLGDHPQKKWLFFRQGRHKNDLPSVCCLGKDDERFADALTSVLEAGDGSRQEENALTLVGDSLCVLRGGEDSRENLFIGNLYGDVHMVRTILRLDAQRQIMSLAAESELNIRLDPMKEVDAEWVEIAFPEDVFAKIDAFAKEKAAYFGARVSGKAPAVYCTWYYYGRTIREENVRMNVRLLAKKKIPFDVVQIDDGWSRCRGDWRPNEKFPAGMESAAREIVANGFIPGIWTSPFIAEETAPIVSEHPEWFLKHTDGSPCLFIMHEMVARVLDVTHPGARAWIKELFKVLRGWGYVYHKLDFTRAAVIQRDCVYYDETVSIATAYRAAVQAVRDGIGEDGYLLLCGGLYDPLIGIVDAQRAGADVLSMWSRNEAQQGGKVQPYTMKQNLLRYYMNHWWHSDPDSLMVRRQKERTLDLNLTYGLLTDAEAKTSTLNQYLGGGLVCSTEPMDRIEDDRLMLLRHILPVLPVKTTPRDLFAGNRYPALVDVSVKNGAWHTLCRINWADEGDEPMQIVIDEAHLGDFAKAHKAFIAANFDGSVIVENLHYGDPVSFGGIAPHDSMVVKIAPQEALPQVVGTDGHFSMGGEIETLTLQDGVLSFKASWRFDWPTRYDILLPAGWHCGDLPRGVSASGRLVRIFFDGKSTRTFSMKLVKED